MIHRIDYVFACHRGRVRMTNQDNLCCDGFCLPREHEGVPLRAGSAAPDEARLFAVFDGTGGEEMGEAAAYIAARTFRGRMMDRGESSLAEACLEANRRIAAFAERARLKCGCTAAMLLFDGRGAAWCGIGDSRICRLRSGGIEYLSEDDVFPARRGGKAPLLQYLGIPEKEMLIVPHTGRVSLAPGDTYFVCTDGLTDMVPEKRLAGAGAMPLAEAGEKLMKEALDLGGRDNITFCLIRPA